MWFHDFVYFEAYRGFRKKRTVFLPQIFSFPFLGLPNILDHWYFKLWILFDLVVKAWNIDG